MKQFHLIARPAQALLAIGMTVATGLVVFGYRLVRTGYNSLARPPHGGWMNRRRLLEFLGSLPLLAGALTARSGGESPPAFSPRVRPGDRGWPSPSEWGKLNNRVEGRLVVPRSPLECLPDSCGTALEALKNPFYIGDEVGLTQTSGWIDAWTSQRSAYAVVAANTQDVIEAVNFARKHRLRLVIKGGGHSYAGTSQAADSLLIWTRSMNAVVLHDAFIAQGCGGRQAPQTAVSIEAGAMWIDAYHAVTTQAGRYVQGGGCTTVGVAGLVQSGGFGSFSKNFGPAAAGLLEAEIVTADGEAIIVNECQHGDLLYALKGGGGGSFGVITAWFCAARVLRVDGAKLTIAPAIQSNRGNNAVRIASLAFASLLVLFTGAAYADRYSDTIELFKNAGASAAFFKRTYAYAVFPTVGEGGFIAGAAHGTGRVYVGDVYTGDTTMTQLSLGFQLGGKAYSEIVFFEDKRALDEFESGSFEFAAGASAIAVTASANASAGTTGAESGASGGKKDATTNSSGYLKGMAVFTIAKGGFMYAVTVAGQKFSYTARVQR